MNTAPTREPGADADISYAQFKALANSIPNLAWMANPDGWLFWYNKRWYDYTGTTPEQMMGWGWQSVHHPDILPEMLKRWTTALSSGEPFEMTFPLRRGTDGSFRTFVTRAEPLRENGKIVGWFGTNTDITDQEQTRERLQLVINELNHRVKNTLATVHSMAVGSFKESDRAALEAFEQRLLLLAQVHEILARDSWTATSLREAIKASVAMFDQSRFDIECCDLDIEPRVVAALAITLHELATNAIKYGALTRDEGQVRIVGATKQFNSVNTLSIVWSEHGGPAISAPATQGFGLRLIKRVLAGDTGASVEHAFDPAGVVCKMVLQLKDGGGR